MDFRLLSDGKKPMNRAPESMHEYYETQGILPTVASLPNTAALRLYVSQREKIFLENLHLPPDVFKGADVLEFGPDSGENALVLANWGAKLTLVEPNPRAWPMIVGNFKKFKLEDHLDLLFKGSLQQFQSRRKFDFIVAEGFLSTLHPASLWINLFRKLLKPGGFLLLSHMEASGMMFDLLWKAAYCRMKGLTKLPPLLAAKELFLTKWETVPHTRSFESWVMDVLENPFFRLKYCYEAGWLYERMEKSGFILYSSWPNYQDSLTITWHKKRLSREERLKRDLPFLERSRLSFALGKKAFLYEQSEKRIHTINQRLKGLISSIDSLINSFEWTTLARAQREAVELEGFISKGQGVFQDRGPGLPASRSIHSLVRLLKAMGGKNPKALSTMCNSDLGLLHSWGLPNHLVVFRAEKLEEPVQAQR